MDILSKANSIVSEYDQIMQQMMDGDIMLNQEKMTSLSRQKSALDESYQLCKQYIDLNSHEKKKRHCYIPDLVLS